jgi:hypothetical protein
MIAVPIDRYLSIYLAVQAHRRQLSEPRKELNIASSNERALVIGERPRVARRRLWWAAECSLPRPRRGRRPRFDAYRVGDHARVVFGPFGVRSVSQRV